MKNINLINGFGLLAIQQDFEQYYIDGRNRLLREERNYRINI